jgi:hypothetical protein
VERIMSHFLVSGTDGTCVLYEVDYTISQHREGVLCYTKVPYSERPCTCPEREAYERRSAAIPK